MVRRTLLTLISFACSVALATTVYKWVDENGVIHYSDQPHPNAQKLQVQGVQTYSSSAARSVSAPADADSGASSPNPYRGCAIAQPLDQQNLPNAESVFIRVEVDPLPRGGDHIFIAVDGQTLNGGQPTGLAFNVTPIDRGEHIATAQVRNSDDQVLCQSPPITFYVSQPGVLNPAVKGQPGVPPRPR